MSTDIRSLMATALGVPESDVFTAAGKKGVVHTVRKNRVYRIFRMASQKKNTDAALWDADRQALLVSVDGRHQEILSTRDELAAWLSMAYADDGVESKVTGWTNLRASSNAFLSDACGGVMGRVVAIRMGDWDVVISFEAGTFNRKDFGIAAFYDRASAKSFVEEAARFVEDNHPQDKSWAKKFARNWRRKARRAG